MGPKEKELDYHVLLKHGDKYRSPSPNFNNYGLGPAWFPVAPLTPLVLFRDGEFWRTTLLPPWPYVCTEQREAPLCGLSGV